jgi:flagellar biosynthesis protein FlhA
VSGPRRLASADLIVTAAVVFVVALLVLPLPGFVLDVLITVSIACSLIVLLVALQTSNPLDLSAFPTLLLLLTLFRLGLNVGSTRLILGEGKGGKVIEAFGGFVVGGNYAVGIVIFLILVAINFVVITKGAGRVAEVAARFTLDAMPGRQMSIDADLNAGMIDEVEARARRREISLEADFYGAMDGSAKFVRGDAVLGLIITGINILGGMYVGMIQLGMPLSAAAQQYTVLTIGDGLVSQIPALIVSTASGILVTYSAGGERVGPALATQLGRDPGPLWATAAILGSLGLIPALPAVPFLLLSATCGGLATLATRSGSGAGAIVAGGPGAGTGGAVGTGLAPGAGAGTGLAVADTSNALEAGFDPIEDLLLLDPVELEVGYAMIPLVDESQGGDLLSRVGVLRKKAAQDLGLLVPPIRIRDDIQLDSGEYVIRLRGSEVARGEVMMRNLLALDTGDVTEAVDGIEVRDPSFGLPARWIPAGTKIDAEARGWTVVEPGAVVATHLMETLKQHGAELLGRQDVQAMIDRLKQSHPALIDEVVPARVSLGVVHRVLQRLLRERVPIRDLVTILESLADYADTSKDPEVLTEHVRRSLSKTIADRFLDDRGSVRGITVGPRLEAALMGLFSPRGSSVEAMAPERLSTAIQELDRLTREQGSTPVPVITPPSLRVGIRKLLEPVLPHVPVISLAELPSHAGFEPLGTWELNDAN